jgi:hypothetical protein
MQRKQRLTIERGARYLRVKRVIACSPRCTVRWLTGAPLPVLPPLAGRHTHAGALRAGDRFCAEEARDENPYKEGTP